MKTGGKKLAKANYGMAVTDDKKKTFVGTGTQPRWTEDTVKRSKSKYPQFSKEIDEAFTNQTKRDQAKADAEIARANVAKKEESIKQTSNMKTMKTGGMNNKNSNVKVSPNTPKMKKGGMAKAMYGKTMMRNGGAKKK